jgi:hypothetical protein
MSARFYYASTDHLFEQGLGNETGFRIFSCHRCQWTSVGPDHYRAVISANFGCASHFLEKHERSIDSVRSGSPFCFRRKFAGKAASQFEQAGSQCLRAEAFPRDGEKVSKQATVGSGENMLCAFSQAIAGVRAAHPGFGSDPPDQAISFQTHQMCANGVVGNAKVVGQLIDGSVPGQEEGKKTAPGALEESLTPSGIFHS